MLGVESVVGGCWCFGCGVVGLLWLGRHGGLIEGIGEEIECGSSVQIVLLALVIWVDAMEGWLTMRYASFRNSSAVSVDGRRAFWEGIVGPCLDDTSWLSVGVRSVIAWWGGC